MEPLALDHFVILTSRPDEGVSFYARLLPLLGFERTSDRIWANAKGLHIKIGDADPACPPYERYGAGVNHVGFAAPSSAFVEQVRERMSEHLAEGPRIQSFGGRAALFLKDPDGFRVEITYTPEGETVVD
ncbi:MAG TPA: VOC family protein [Caulobacteraceae bacterium]|nr:VOC family protein [Caulobacteraceae bacterium]